MSSKVNMPLPPTKRPPPPRPHNLTRNAPPPSPPACLLHFSGLESPPYSLEARVHKTQPSARNRENKPANLPCLPSHSYSPHR